MIQQCRYIQLYQQTSSRQCLREFRSAGATFKQVMTGNMWPVSAIWNVATNWIGGMKIALKAIISSILYLLLEYPKLIDSIFDIDTNNSGSRKNIEIGESKPLIRD